MSTLYEHIVGHDLAGVEVPKLEIHQFIAAAAEHFRGKLTKPQAAAIFPFLTGTAATEVGSLLDLAAAGTITRERLQDVLAIAELERGVYTTEAEVKAELGY